jgi:hypothetical protein
MSQNGMKPNGQVQGGLDHLNDAEVNRVTEPVEKAASGQAWDASSPAAALSTDGSTTTPAYFRNVARLPVGVKHDR